MEWPIKESMDSQRTMGDVHIVKGLMTKRDVEIERSKEHECIAQIQQTHRVETAAQMIQQDLALLRHTISHFPVNPS